MNSYNEDFLDLARRAKPVNPDKLSRYTVRNDRYDVRDLNRILKQIPEFTASRETLVSNIAGDPGFDIAGDLFWGFLKVQPEALDEDEIRPSRRVNAFVRDEAMDLDEFIRLRRWTMGDDVGSALAFQTIEPDLEIIYDKLKQAQQLANEYEQRLRELMQALQDERSAEQIYQDWAENHEAEEDGDEAKALAQAAEDARAQSENAQQAADAAKQALEGELAEQATSVRLQLQGALGRAADDISTQDEAANMWSDEPGMLRRLPAQKRIDLAKRVRNNPKFARLAQLFGAFKRFAFAQQRVRVPYIPEEFFDIEQGNDLTRILPTELLRADDPDLEILFLKDYVDRALLLNAFRGYETLAKGGIIYVHDGSGSMSGEHEIWAKAIGLALLHIARKQKREFVAIQFGSRSEMRIDDFREEITPEKVLGFAEFFFGGGTDFETPLTEALKMLDQEHQRKGSIKGDIVFATDGWCNVRPQWLEHFKKEQHRLGFRVWGINIDSRNIVEEPMLSICDGRVSTLHNLLTAEDIRTIFQGI